MGSKKLIISGGQIVLPAGVEVLDIVIEDGSIADLVPPNSVSADIERFDASGLTILPGAIDAHIHLGHAKDIARPREPSDSKTETAAAARGGVTTVISYVMNANPHEDDFEDILSVTKAGARTDFGFHFVIATRAQLQAVPRYINEFGVPTAKLFMNIRGSEGNAWVCRRSMTGLPLPCWSSWRLMAACSAHTRKTWKSPGSSRTASNPAAEPTLRHGTMLDRASSRRRQFAGSPTSLR